MNTYQKVISYRIIRFGLVGIFNTLLHFIVLNVSYIVLHFGKFTSSLIATILALSFSFILNRNVVFRVKSGRLAKQSILFVITTVTGMLLIHNSIYMIVLKLGGVVEEKLAALLGGSYGIMISHDTIGINIATLMGALVATLWNYHMYKKVVFPVGDSQDENAA